MRSIAFALLVAPIFMVGGVSAYTKRKSELLNLLQKRTRKLQDTGTTDSFDQEATCFGAFECFETTTISDVEGDDLTYIFKYPDVMENAEMTCTLNCNTRVGEVILEAAVINGGTLTPGAEGSEIATSSSGCPVTLNIKAAEDGTFFAGAFCEDGCRMASMLCQQCAPGGDTGTAGFQALWYSVVGYFRRQGQGSQRHLNKYIRGSQ